MKPDVSDEGGKSKAHLGESQNLLKQLESQPGVNLKQLAIPKLTPKSISTQKSGS